MSLRNAAIYQDQIFSSFENIPSLNIPFIKEIPSSDQVNTIVKANHFNPNNSQSYSPASCDTRKRHYISHTQWLGCLSVQRNSHRHCDKHKLDWPILRCQFRRTPGTVPAQH